MHNLTDRSTQVPLFLQGCDKHSSTSEKMNEQFIYQFLQKHRENFERNVAFDISRDKINMF